MGGARASKAHGREKSGGGKVAREGRNRLALINWNVRHQDKGREARRRKLASKKGKLVALASNG